MLLEFLYWWYGPGWLGTVKRIGHRVVAIMQIFSVPILLATLFSPWKRIISESDGSLDMMVRSVVDNAVSRTVGFVVRIIVISTALLFTSVASIVGFLIAVLWPLLPVTAMASLLMAIFGGLVK